MAATHAAEPRVSWGPRIEYGPGTDRSWHQTAEVTAAGYTLGKLKVLRRGKTVYKFTVAPSGEMVPGHDVDYLVSLASESLGRSTREARVSEVRVVPLRPYSARMREAVNEFVTVKL